jgi:hypothetical protein
MSVEAPENTQAMRRTGWRLRVLAPLRRDVPGPTLSKVPGAI